MRTFAEKPKVTPQNTSAKSMMFGLAHFGERHEVNSILHLQRTIGNQAVQRSLQDKPDDLEAISDATASGRFGHDFSQMPVHAHASGKIQPKLAVNTPGDVYEEEADRLSEQVMRMPEPQLQHACPCGGGCPRCQEEHGRQKHLETERVQAGGPRGTEVPPIVHEVLHSPGQPLDPAARAFMEPRFGHDFAKIRVHTDNRAAESAEAVNALAYTLGDKIVFGTGQYSPTTETGRRLLAHELAHSVQQGFAANPFPLLSDPRRALQRQVGEAAAAVYLKEDKSPGTGCRNVLTQRWGCDTACSRAGFVDYETPFTDEHGEKGKSGCCNKWPPFVESYAITQLSLNGAASCKGAMYKKIFKVMFKEKEIRIACTDSTTSNADHDLELSPAAAMGLFETFTFPLNTQVKVCADGALSQPPLCELDNKKLNNPNNPSFPSQRDCVEKGCKPQDPFYDCSRYDWPKV